MKFLLFIVLVVTLGVGCSRDCLQGEMKPVYHESWLQPVSSGKTTVLIRHPAHTSTDFVCNEYAPE